MGQCRSRAKALHADSHRSIFPMDCSRWKALPSGRRRLRRTTTASPYFLFLRNALIQPGAHRRNAQNFTRSQPHCNSLIVPTFEAFRKPNALTNNPPQINIITALLRVAIPTTKHNVESPSKLLKTINFGRTLKRIGLTNRNPKRRIVPDNDTLQASAASLPHSG